ncbi:MAG: tRNA uridine-5-carboxymethylaminomethyl(34) synthesis GTPase MnmE [Nitrospirota bacterium]|nr:tRNA uridine-5-carboxymethylaminomethyl(34) synthesis GTPase MnmE [Nitrospirota bacterium]
MTRSVEPLSDTICAPATAPGEGAVGIVRLSGPRAVELAERVFMASSGLLLGNAPSHTVHHGWIRAADGAVVDEALALLMRAPRSYTTENVVELQCHGGGAAIEAVLRLLVSAGCRMAEPGEFTRRAFLNGRIDLTRAEAVLEVIQARSAAAHRIAQRQMGGALAEHLAEIADTLRELAAHEEAAIDFPDENLEAELPADTVLRLESARGRLAEAIRRGQAGHLLREGVRLAILGRPNVGKSSLLNRLLGHDRAIVADTPGTTRDVLEAELAIDGVRFVLQDTAGIRATGDRVEAEGVSRSRRAARGAEVLLLVLDASSGLTEEDLALLAELDPARLLVAVNKSDLGSNLAGSLADFLPGRLPEEVPVVAVSALTGDGMAALGAALVQQVCGPGAAPLEHAFLLNARQRDALERALEGTKRALEGIADHSPADLLASDIRTALDAIGEITGETTTDDLLGLIFSRFCIGK